MANKNIANITAYFFSMIVINDSIYAFESVFLVKSITTTV